MNRLAVYCGSSPGTDPAFAEAAELLGKEMARRKIGLVYGGGRLGLMGIVADSVLAAGGEAFGVIPRALIELEVAHRGLTELHVVDTMHERKARMTDLADAFVALPGGIGTLDELFEPAGNALGIMPTLSHIQRPRSGPSDRLMDQLRQAVHCRSPAVTSCLSPTMSTMRSSAWIAP